MNACMNVCAVVVYRYIDILKYWIRSVFLGVEHDCATYFFIDIYFLDRRNIGQIYMYEFYFIIRTSIGTEIVPKIQ
jgi:hypothetical protein